MWLFARATGLTPLTHTSLLATPRIELDDETTSMQKHAEDEPITFAPLAIYRKIRVGRQKLQNIRHPVFCFRVIIRLGLPRPSSPSLPCPGYGTRVSRSAPDPSTHIESWCQAHHSYYCTCWWVLMCMVIGSLGLPALPTTGGATPTSDCRTINPRVLYD